ncbi:MAG: glycosyltransferase family 2 protein [Parachlamydiaceae bacterium]
MATSVDCARHSTFCFVLNPHSTSKKEEEIFLDFIQKVVREGYEVTIFSLYGEIHGDLKRVAQTYTKNLRLASFSYCGPPVSSLEPALQSYYVMQWLLENPLDFDVVYFPLTGGIGYYSFLAKHQGWAFQHSIFCVDCHASFLWDKHQNKQSIDHINDLAIDFLEKQSVRLADWMIQHDDTLLDWMKSEGWPIAEKGCCFSYQGDRFDPPSFFKKLKNEAQSDLILMNERQESPLISVCLTHFNRPDYLAQALDSLRQQDYSPFEVILVDDGSTQSDAIAYLDHLEQEFQSKGWKIIRNKENLFPGAARNLAVSQSRGSYILFMDDDNYANPDQISTFVKVSQRVNADILTCAMDIFIGTDAPFLQDCAIRRFLPIGGAPTLGLYLNMFGDMNALIKKTVYHSLHGLTEERGVGAEDWEFFSRAVLQGYHLEVIPLALFWYRDTPISVTKTTHRYDNALRGIRPYLDAVPLSLRYTLILSQAQHERVQALLSEYHDLRKMLKHCGRLLLSKANKAIRSPISIIRKYFLPKK